MNEVLKAIQERRSIRKFKPDMVPCQLVDEIITAGLYAASGMGRQNTKIIAITDKSIRDKFSDMNRAIGGWKEGFDPFYGAPVVLLVIADKSEGKELLTAAWLWATSCWQHMTLVLAVAGFIVPKRKWNPNWARNFCKNWVSKEAGRELATVYLAILMGKSQRLHPVKITVCIM